MQFLAAAVPQDPLPRLQRREALPVLQAGQEQGEQQQRQQQQPPPPPPQQQEQERELAPLATKCKFCFLPPAPGKELKQVQV